MRLAQRLGQAVGRGALLGLSTRAAGGGPARQEVELARVKCRGAQVVDVEEAENAAAGEQRRANRRVRTTA